MLKINTPPGSPPRDLLDDALRQVIGRVQITASMSGQPPQLHPSIVSARIAQELDDVDELVRALYDIAHAAIASAVRVRATQEG